jgi:hypothetical protein
VHENQGTELVKMRVQNEKKKYIIGKGESRKRERKERTDWDAGLVNASWDAVCDHREEQPQHATTSNAPTLMIGAFDLDKSKIYVEMRKTNPKKYKQKSTNKKET